MGTTFTVNKKIFSCKSSKTGFCARLMIQTWISAEKRGPPGFAGHQSSSRSNEKTCLKRIKERIKDWYTSGFHTHAGVYVSLSPNPKYTGKEDCLSRKCFLQIIQNVGDFFLAFLKAWTNFIESHSKYRINYSFEQRHLGKMPQQVKTMLLNITGWIWSQEPIWCKERTNS